MASSEGRLRVLWADDQPDVIEALSPYLGLECLEIVPATTAGEAEDLFRQGGFDLCLLDLQMPPGRWGGLELLRSLGGLTRAMPIIVLSGVGTLKECIEAQRLGARDYVHKEQAPEELAGVVAGVLNKAGDDAKAADYSRIAALEKKLHGIVISSARREAQRRNCDMFVGVIPRKVALKSYERLLDQGEGGQEDFFDLVDLRDILDSLWAALPEARELEATLKPKSRDARTSWLAELNECRKIVMHPTRGGLDTASRKRLADIEALVARWEKAIEL